MPLKSGNGGDVDENVVSRLESKVRWSPDDQADHSGGEDDAHGDPGFALFAQTPGTSEVLFQPERGQRVRQTTSQKFGAWRMSKTQ